MTVHGVGAQKLYSQVLEEWDFELELSIAAPTGPHGENRETLTASLALNPLLAPWPGFSSPRCTAYNEAVCCASCQNEVTQS